MSSNNTQLLESWNKRLREIQHSQYEAAKILTRNHYWFGVPSLITTTVVTSAIFSTLQKQNISECSKIIFGVVSILSALLVGIQTFFKFGERAEKHRTFGAKAGNLRRQLEQHIAGGNIESFSEEKIDKIRDSYDEISRDAPAVSNSVWEKAQKVMSQP